MNNELGRQEILGSNLLKKTQIFSASKKESLIFSASKKESLTNSFSEKVQFPSLSKSDLLHNDLEKLHSSALEIASRYRKNEAELLHIISLVDEKKVFLSFGFSSLFSYCIKALKLSEGTSYNLIGVSRKSRVVPELQKAVESGELSLSTANKISSVITPENQNEWIKNAKELPRGELEKEVASVNPKAATPEKASYVSAKRISLRLGLSEELFKLFKRVQDLESKRQRKSLSLEEVLEVLIPDYIRKNDPVVKAERAKGKRAQEKIGAEEERAQEQRTKEGRTEEEQAQEQQAPEQRTKEGRTEEEQAQEKREAEWLQAWGNFEGLLGSTQSDKLRRTGRSKTARASNGSGASGTSGASATTGTTDSPGATPATRANGRTGATGANPEKKSGGRDPISGWRSLKEGDLTIPWKSFGAGWDGSASNQSSIPRKISMTGLKNAPADRGAIPWKSSKINPNDIPFLRSPIRAELKHQVYNRDQDHCQKCGQTRFTEIHHIIPISHGGTNELANLQTLCSGCHKLEHRSRLRPRASATKGSAAKENLNLRFNRCVEKTLGV